MHVGSAEMYNQNDEPSFIRAGVNFELLCACSTTVEEAEDKTVPDVIQFNVGRVSTRERTQQAVNLQAVRPRHERRLPRKSILPSGRRPRESLRHATTSRARHSSTPRDSLVKLHLAQRDSIPERLPQIFFVERFTGCSCQGASNKPGQNIHNTSLHLLGFKISQGIGAGG